MCRLNKLKGLRVEKGLTQSDIAEYLKISKNSYHRKETGSNEFSLNEAYKLSLLFEKTLEEIFFKNEVTKTITNETKAS